MYVSQIGLSNIQEANYFSFTLPLHLGTMYIPSPRPSMYINAFKTFLVLVSAFVYRKMVLVLVGPI